MLVYHFRDKKFGFKSLREKRLKISRANELNDPFELLGCRLTENNFRQALNDMKNTFSNEIGILCFSQNWRSPVQWTHYADKHRGLCLGFEVDDKMLAKVNYVSRRLPIQKIDENFMLKILTTKFSHWRYEKEYRGFWRFDPATEENGLFYKEFSDSLILKKVIVGCNSDISRNDISLIIKDKNIECFKARPAFASFRIVKNRNEKLWT